MRLIRVTPDPTRRQLTVFGLLWLVFFGVTGMIVLERGEPAVGAAMTTAAVLVPAMGLVWPRLLRAVYLGAAYATYPIGVVVSWLLLAAMYYCVLTPIGLFMRAIGHDPLNRSSDAGAESYWVARDADEGTETYFRQF